MLFPLSPGQQFLCVSPSHMLFALMVHPCLYHTPQRMRWRIPPFHFRSVHPRHLFKIFCLWNENFHQTYLLSMLKKYISKSIFFQNSEHQKGKHLYLSISPPHIGPHFADTANAEESSGLFSYLGWHTRPRTAFASLTATQHCFQASNSTWAAEIFVCEEISAFWRKSSE